MFTGICSDALLVLAGSPKGPSFLRRKPASCIPLPPMNERARIVWAWMRPALWIWNRWRDDARCVLFLVNAFGAYDVPPTHRPVFSHRPLREGPEHCGNPLGYRSKTQQRSETTAKVGDGTNIRSLDLPILKNTVNFKVDDVLGANDG